MLGEITRVKKTDGYYFVRDDFGLYAFDEEGHFINEISQKGNGNKEYVHLENFYIDEQQKAIGLICNPSPKIMFFSYDGEYLSTVRLPEEDGGIHSIMKSPDQDYWHTILCLMIILKSNMNIKKWKSKATD